MRIEVDPKAPSPPSEQIADQVRYAVASGRMKAGDRLPSVRGLAETAIVNPNTVAKAYRDLEREGTVETRGLTMRFGKKRVLDGIDLDVPTGSVTALLGRNGIGKSTLLRILVGFHLPTSGTATVLGIDPAKRGPDVRRLVGYVPDRLE